MHVLQRYGFPNATWIETGTYLGETTATLSKSAQQVLSLEPAENLYNFTKRRLRKKRNIKIINGTSEELFQSTIDGIHDPVCFWLDGHASGDITYCGNATTPIVHELEAIAKSRPKWNEISVLVDDVRGFNQEFSDNGGGYPSINFLVNWAKECNLGWRIEHDIFIASTLIR